MAWPPGLVGVLGSVAVVLSGLAAVSGNPIRATRASIDVDGLTGDVEHGSDQVSPVQLARWIRDRKAGLRIFDLRSAGEFDNYSVPGATRIALRDLRSTQIAPEETVVLYSDRSAPAAQEWLFLRAVGAQHVYYLRGGVSEWAAVILNPTLRPDASPDERAAFAAAAPLSRYFGGQPRVAGPGETVDPFPTAASDVGADSNTGPPPAAAPSVRPHWRQSC